LLIIELISERLRSCFLIYSILFAAVVPRKNMDIHKAHLN